MDEENVQAQLALLMEEHRDLDDAISALERSTSFDQLQVQRLKKRKLNLKDQMAKLRDLLLPDIIA